MWRGLSLGDDDTAGGGLSQPLSGEPMGGLQKVQGGGECNLEGLPDFNFEMTTVFGIDFHLCLVYFT